MPRSHGVTQAQIAKAAGVSQAVVSDIVSGSMRITVSDETRSRVLALASKLGYLPKRPPGASPTNVLLVESPPPPITNDAWLESAYHGLMGGIVSACQQRLAIAGYGLTFAVDTGVEATMQRLGRGDAAGVLWRSGDQNAALLDWIASRQPLVLLNRYPSGAQRFDCVRIDQERNVSLAVEHLWLRGHRRIAFFGNTPGSAMHALRREAYRQCMATREARIYEDFLRLPDLPKVAAVEKARAMLALIRALGADAPTALITADVFALTILQEAERFELRVPDDLSVIGIDNTAASAFSRPQLTAIDEPFTTMAQTGVDLLLRRMEDPTTPAQVVEVAPSLVERASVAAR